MMIFWITIIRLNLKIFMIFFITDLMFSPDAIILATLLEKKRQKLHAG